MRKPARTMLPRSAPSAMGLMAFWALLGVALPGLVWLASPQAILASAAVVALVIAATWKTVRSERARLLRMASSRNGECLCQFARSFDTRAVDTSVIRAVRDSIQHSLDFTHLVRRGPTLCDLKHLDAHGPVR